MSQPADAADPAAEPGPSGARARLGRLTPGRIARAAGGRLRRRFGRSARLTRRVKARKAERAALPYRYLEAPTLSLVIQSFNHRGNIASIVERLRETPMDELIVCEDGSVDGSDREWRRHLDRPNDFLVQSNDLHEIRTYNRAVGLARGTIVGFLQDDDIPPADPRWLADALALFERMPELGVLGCLNGVGFDFDADGDAIYLPVGVGFDAEAGRIPHLDPRTGVPFTFVEAVGIGPLFVRRAAFEALGGFDHALSGPGEPGIWLDYDLSLRAWREGWKVGLYEVPEFRRSVGGQGTLLFAPQLRFANYARNLELVRDRHRAAQPSIARTVATANLALDERPGRDGSVPAASLVLD